MNNSTINKILTFLILVVLGWNIYALKDNFGNFLKPLLGERNPCNQPITYSIGEVDSRFGISKNEFAQIISNGIEIWEKPIGKTLFKSSDSGELKINLIYDSRQDATQKLKQLGINITADQAGYNALKSRYDSAMADYNQLNSNFQNSLNTYNAEKSAYEQQINYWNSKGGAPKNEYNKLQQQKATLDSEATALNQLRSQINSKSDEINALAATLNQLAEKLNLSINTYNGIGTQQGQEFEEGIFSSDESGMTINIYQFDNRTKLIRVIAHELGHALGIDHIDNPQAIMYKLNFGTNLTLSTEDLQALKNICRLSY